MDILELIKNSIIMNVELHALLLVLICIMFNNMRNSYKRNNKKSDVTLKLVYIYIALMVASDCLWTVVSSLGHVGNVAAYSINIIYFISSASATAGWFVFCAKMLDHQLSSNKMVHGLAMIPYSMLMLLYILSPFFGFIFSIENGEYIRGSLFFLDPIIKLGYIVASSTISSLYGKKKAVGFLRKRDYNLAAFGIPVIICGIVQTITGTDFNCLGVTLGLILIYITGITNLDNENTNVIYSLANSFDASYIVNMHTGEIRALCVDEMHDPRIPAMQSLDYSEHFKGVLSEIILPEDKEKTLNYFELKNIAKRFKVDNAFSIRYRIKEKSGVVYLHSATFIKAFGNDGRNEFLIGINQISQDSLLNERHENLSRDRKNLENINTNIIESVAKIVDARDNESGGHIVRVKKITEVIANEMMKEFPELDLDEERIKLISSASVLHDVGKIVIPDAILLKPGRLTDDEFAVMKTHTTKGCDILNLFPLGLDDAFLDCALCICRWHHEKYDGNGYPDGLKGDDIPLSAQIVSAADCFDALVSDRPYKPAYSPNKAIEMIVNGECGEFSPKIISAISNRKNKLNELARLYK